MLVALLVLTVPSARADELYGKIRGTVTDSTGAVIPGATIRATGEQTGISKETNSAADGTYEFLQLLAPASYKVTVERTGFKTFTVSGIHLDLNQIFVQNITLDVGTVKQAVTVEAAATQIDTTSMQLGVTTTASQIVDMPLNGRDWTQLQQLQPGVVGASDIFGSYSTNGSETQQNSYLINGLDINQIETNTVGFLPSPDAIGEFHMVTNTINPEFGRNSGAIINAVIKNGTNQFHGDAFEFYRDTFLNARSFFQSSASVFHQNQFGGTIGGPIKKDRTFFFVSYQGKRAVQPQSYGLQTVFTDAERGGNFNDRGLASSTGIAAFPLVGDDGTTYPAGTPFATIFSGGYIPSVDMNPLAVKYMNQYIPKVNYGTNEFTFNPSQVLLDDQIIYRVDENLSSKDALWFNGAWERNPDTQTLPDAGGYLPGFGEIDRRTTQVYSGSWTHTFSPTTLNEARMSYYRFVWPFVDPANPINPAQYGFTGIHPQFGGTSSSLPLMSLFGMFTSGFSWEGPQNYISQTYEVTDNFSKVVGHHTLKMGFTMERMQAFDAFSVYNNGAYDYYGFIFPWTTSVPGANFLLGLPDIYIQSNGNTLDHRGREYYGYFQDQWQVKKNLTLTLGTGYDLESPYLSLYDQGEGQIAWRPGQQSKIFPTAPVGFVWPGDEGINKYGGPTYHYGDFAPRVGFAWSPRGSSKFAVRGGVGIYYNRTEEETVLQNLISAPFTLVSTSVLGIGGTPNFGEPFTGNCGLTACSVPQPFPFVIPKPGQNVDFSPFYPMGGNVKAMDPKMVAPRAANFNLGVDWQVSPSTTASIRYVGNQGRHLEGAYTVNYAGNADGTNPAALAAGCTSGLSLNSVPGCAATFPYNPNIYGQPGVEATDFNSNYNALQIEVNRRLTRGLQFQVAYTWSRYFDEGSNLFNGIDYPPPADFKGMYAPSANDAPQRLVVNYHYTLPFYHLAHRWKRVTDGWSLVGITTFQHGFPVAVSDSAEPSLTCDGNVVSLGCPDRANRTSTPEAIGNPRNYTIGGAPNYWLNPASFAVPAPSTGYGNASRNPFYAAGINNWDMSLMKDVHIDEARFFQFRFETFNTFNHAQFGGPVGDINDPRFGRILGTGPGRVVQLAGKFYF
jgi:hypothetical protein